MSYKDQAPIVRDMPIFRELKKYVELFQDLQKDEVEDKGDGWVSHVTRGTINFGKPYTLEEVEAFESRNNIELPIELKVYLTEISRHLYKKHLEFQLIELKDSESLSKSFPLTQNFTPYRRLVCGKTDDKYDVEIVRTNVDACNNMTNEEVVSYIDDEIMITPSQFNRFKNGGYFINDFEWDPLVDKSLFNGTLLIRRIGCGYTNRIVLNGLKKGQMLKEQLVGDGPIRIEYESFLDYAVIGTH